MKCTPIILIVILWFSINEVLKGQIETDSIDSELLEIDIEDVKSNYYNDLELPLSIGAFPVKSYPGSGGAADLDFEVKNKRLVGGSFSIGESKDSHKFFTYEKSHEIFCNIIVLTDHYDEKEYSHISNFLTSRNHPNYLGMGTVYTSNQEIDYIAFIDVESNKMVSYVIVSGKLFNLDKGNTIVVIPQKDNSLRFLQISIKSDFDTINSVLQQEFLDSNLYREIIRTENIGN